MSTIAHKMLLLSGKAPIAQIVTQLGATFLMNPFKTLYQDGALTTPAADGEAVGGVPDQTGNSNTASNTLTNRPVFDADGINGRPSVFFTASSSQYLNVNSLAAAITGTDVPHTVISVSLNATFPAQPALFAAGRSSSGTPFVIYGTTNTPQYLMQRRDDANSIVSAAGGTPVLTTARVLATRFNGTTVDVWRDNNLIINAAAFDVGALTLDRCSIGALVRNTVANHWDGHIGYLAFFPSALSTANVQAVSRRFGADYGISVA